MSATATRCLPLSTRPTCSQAANVRLTVCSGGTRHVGDILPRQRKRDLKKIAYSLVKLLYQPHHSPGYSLLGGFVRKLPQASFSTAEPSLQ